MLSSSGSVLKVLVNQFKSYIPNQCKKTYFIGQHDCQEFVTLLLEGLRKQMSLKLPAKLNNDDDILCCSKTSPAAPLQVLIT
jgi:ubiquitin C-terminal hydrolase